MAVLVHVCCAPCLLGPLELLRGRRFSAYFYNPNIHPLIEFRRRLKALHVLAEQLSLDVLCDENYALTEFLSTVDWRSPNRCRDCYRLRLRRTAETARARGFEAFTSTLLASPTQPHELIRQIGEQAAREAGTTFAYDDWRRLADAGLDEARRRSLYRQQYCGCIFSEYERYKDTALHLHRPAASNAGG